MTTFDNREKAAEGKFVLDAEMEFKATARRNKMVGRWAAGLLGLSGEGADKYAAEVVASDFEEAGDADVIRKLAKDLSAKNVSEADIKAKLAEAMAEAVKQIKAGA